MNKTLTPVVKDGLGILARLFVITLLLSLLSGLLQGCTDECETFYTYTQYEPVMVTMAEVQKTIGVKEARTLKQPGKIYIKDHYLFISEAGEGIHVIDNTDKTNPVPKAFIEVPGSYDMAVLGSVLYTDSYTDLLAFDISDVQDIRQVGHVENVFFSRGTHYFSETADNQLIVDYAEVLVQSTEPMDCDEQGNIWRINDFMSLEGGSFAGGSGGDVVNFAGQGGSMARFALQSNYLYALDASSLYVFDLQEPFNPEKAHDLGLSWNVETIFPYEQDKLFIGTSDGMHILDSSDPSMPKLASSLAHFTACDPVVVENDIAYVTLRSGNACEGIVNQLDVVDVSDIYNPQILATYPMQNPHGLGIDGGKLFLCEGDYGLKVFDATDIYKIAENMVEHRSDIHAFDVIPFENVLLLIGNDGFYQYDYSDINNIKLLSHIAVTPEN